MKGTLYFVVKQPEAVVGEGQSPSGRCTYADKHRQGQQRPKTEAGKLRWQEETIRHGGVQRKEWGKVH